MNKIGIFYGSSTGRTADVARRLSNLLEVPAEDVHNVANTDPAVLGDYSLIVLGSSTYGLGNLQKDWYDFMAGASVLDLKGKKMALFGVGDQTMADTFCNAVGKLYEGLKGTGATLVGEYPADVYNFRTSSASAEGPLMYGLLLDEVNRPDLTPKRLVDWAAMIKKA